MRKIKSVAIRAFIGIAIASLMAGSADATLTWGDDPIHGIGSITIDDVNNLEWLALSKSLGLIFDAVSVLFGPSQTFEGFRYATFAEITGLYASVPSLKFALLPIQ